MWRGLPRNGEDPDLKGDRSESWELDAGLRGKLGTWRGDWDEKLEEIRPVTQKRQGCGGGLV